jgi:hypothetical protein
MVRWQVAETEVVSRHGLRVTSIALTVVDVVGEQGLPWSLMTVDAALARGVHETDLVTTGQRRPTNRKRCQIIDVVELGDPASESALESTSRGCMVQNGLPIPLCNVVLRLGDRWYRVDFLWLELGVVGECDGKTKYLNADVKEVLWREKRRHERIEESGFRVVRWGYAEVAGDAAAMVRRIRRAMDAQRPLGFTWPDDVRAEVPVREGVQPPPRVVAEVKRLQALDYPITFVDEWGEPRCF